MTKVRMNYDGWLALPAALRQKLGLSTGDQLDLEIVGGTVVLRPLKSAVAAEPPAGEELPSVPVQREPAPAVVASPGVKRGPGRPRKPAAAPLGAGIALPPRLKARGAKKAVPADQTSR